MGTFEVTIAIGDPRAQGWEALEMLVDTGSTYAWVPADVLQRLGVQPLGREKFETSDDPSAAWPSDSLAAT